MAGAGRCELVEDGIRFDAGRTKKSLSVILIFPQIPFSDFGLTATRRLPDYCQLFQSARPLSLVFGHPNISASIMLLYLSRNLASFGQPSIFRVDATFPSNTSFQGLRSPFL